MNKICRQCAQPFEVTAKDLEGLESLSPIIDGKKYPIPAPTLCFDCGQQRRIAFRNELKLYNRPCDLCKKEIVSLYSPDKPFTVYCSDCWWSDKWNAATYGRDFDFSRPFFDQIKELLHTVPLLANAVWNSVNCEYNNYCVGSKDCYMSARLGDSENITYSYLAIHCIGCTDCAYIIDCQYCYECIDCWNCYNSYFCQLCKNCSDCYFCFDCIGSKNCFGSVGLRNCEYYFFNKKCTKEEYEKLVAEYDLGSYETLQKVAAKFKEERLKKPHRSCYITNCENVSGNYIVESKDVHNSFDVEKTDTCRNSWAIEYAKNIFNCSFIYYGENCYETMSNSRSSNILFSTIVIEGVYDVMYSMMLVNATNNCFGSVSLNKGKYCILNKQYSQEEYEKLVPKIIEHMKKTGGRGGQEKEWGEFFPADISPFAYNETVAQTFFPLTKAEALAKDFQWKDPDKKEYKPQTYEIPDNIKNIPESIIKEVLACKQCGKNYKIIPQELKTYKSSNLPVPQECFECRHNARIAKRGPRKLWDRKCAKCQSPVKTSFEPGQPETVYCEACYLKEVY